MNAITVTLNHYTPLYIASDGARTCWSSQDKSDTSDCMHDLFHWEHDQLSDNEFIAKWGIVPSLDLEIGPKDLALLDRVGNQFHHGSILEHISFNFFIDGISRACLQELARHRIASLSVKSSRYTLKELKNEKLIISRSHVEGNTDYKYQGDGWWIKDGVPYYSDRLNSELVYDTKLVEQYCVIPQNLMSYSKKLHYVNKGRMLWCVQENLKEGQSNDIAKYDLGESYRTQLTWSINLRSLQNFLSLRTDKKALPEIQYLANLIYASLPTDIQSLVTHCIKE